MLFPPKMISFDFTFSCVCVMLAYYVHTHLHRLIKDPRRQMNKKEQVSAEDPLQGNKGSLRPPRTEGRETDRELLQWSGILMAGDGSR